MRTLFLLGVVAAFPIASLSTAHGQVVHAALSGDEDAQFGHALARVGDLNGDGCDELAIGEPRKTVGTLVDAGRVTVIDGRSGTSMRIHDGTRADDRFGSNIAALDDWDGDGVPDYAIAAILDDTNATDCGAIHAWSGATGALLRTFHGTSVVEQLGEKMTGIGDADGDGVGDLLVGLPQFGSARLYTSTGALHKTLTGSAATRFGTAPTRLDDVDGDGRDDFALGEPGFDFLSLDLGRVLIYSVATQAVIGSVWGQSGEQLGTSLAALGDLDGDGIDDFAIGAPDFSTSFNALRIGRALVCSGATNATLFTLDGVESDDQLGHALCGTPDLDGDGVPDFAVTLLHGGAGDLGSVEVHAGSDGRLLWQVEGAAGPAFANHALGSPLAGGDWNGDGLGDLALGDPSFQLFDAVAGLWREVGLAQLHLGAPSSFASFGAGWPGTLGVPTLTPNGEPALGTTLDVAVTSSAPASALALLLVGSTSAAIPWRGGTLLVLPDLTTQFFTLPAAGTTLSEDLPDDPALALLGLYVQLAIVDPGASRGISLSAGLELHLGYDLP